MNNFTNVWRLSLPVALASWMFVADANSSQAASAHRRAVSSRHQKKVQRPRITSLDPEGYSVENGPDFHRDSVTHGAADNPDSVLLTVRGYSFQRGAVICWNGHRLPTKFVSSVRLETTIPMSLLEDVEYDDPAQGLITVVNSRGKIRVSLPAPFEVSHWAMGG